MNEPERHRLGRSAAGPILLVGVLTAAVAACGVTVASPGLPGPSSPTAPAVIASTTPSERPSANPSPPATPWATSDLALAWSDEFDGPAGSPPDSATWGYDLGDGSANGIPGWGNRERQWYTSSTDNAALDGKGNLVITVISTDKASPPAGTEVCYYGTCEYTSARLLTKDRREVTYGRIEARIKVPGGRGLWPAFWMLGNDLAAVGWPKSGEIDIMEFVGRRPNEILGTVHGPGYSGSSGITNSVDLGRPVADAFHTYAIDWQPGRITWSLDGKVFHEAGPADVAPNAWVFDHPFFLILNVAVGGNLGGPVDPDTVFPQTMTVDYVRFFEGMP